MKDGFGFGARFGAGAERKANELGGLGIDGFWEVVCRGPDGKIKWADTIHNLITNEGLNHALDVVLSGGTQDTTWFIGLTDGTPTAAAGDTLASHAGWVEVADYDEANRVAFVDAGASSQSLSNTASPAVFTIDTNGTTVGGAFLAGVNTGTSGTLFAVGAFSAGDKSLDDNDTLTVTVTFTAADA